jgi:hypothetical protein
LEGPKEETTKLHTRTRFEVTSHKSSKNMMANTNSFGGDMDLGLLYQILKYGGV